MSHAGADGQEMGWKWRDSCWPRRKRQRRAPVAKPNILARIRRDSHGGKRSGSHRGSPCELPLEHLLRRHNTAGDLDGDRRERLRDEGTQMVAARRVEFRYTLPTYQVLLASSYWTKSRAKTRQTRQPGQPENPHAPSQPMIPVEDTSITRNRNTDLGRSRDRCRRLGWHAVAYAMIRRFEHAAGGNRLPFPDDSDVKGMREREGHSEGRQVWLDQKTRSGK